MASGMLKVRVRDLRRISSDSRSHEGMYNEGIVSTFIYYYHSENIQDTRLSFRQATAEPFYHEQDDSFCMKTPEIGSSRRQRTPGGWKISRRICKPS